MARCEGGFAGLTPNLAWAAAKAVPEHSPPPTKLLRVTAAGLSTSHFVRGEISDTQRSIQTFLYAGRCQVHCARWQERWFVGLGQ